jgi:putative mRNA 3-end processing factor
MSGLYPVDVSSSGAVLLGHDVTCDGFHRDFPARVQTHIHVDHMGEFETSKGFQDIFLREPTYRLLISELNADLPYRENIRIVEPGVAVRYRDSTIALTQSGHMLGAAQVLVTLPNGMRLGYSGDFQWPLDNVIQVDALVVDSTYGSPRSRREYSQADVESRLLQLVADCLKRGPVHIKSHRGTIERALQALAGDLSCPIVGSAPFCLEVELYREFGYGIDTVCSIDSEEGRAALAQGRFVRFYGKGDGVPVDVEGGTTIVLSAYMARLDDPVMQFTDRSYSVALSSHADFDGTVEYVRATGAKYVVTDNSRGGHGIELAVALRSLLNVEAVPSSGELTKEWGM